MTLLSSSRSITLTVIVATVLLSGLSVTTVAQTPHPPGTIPAYDDIKAKLSEHPSGLPIYIASSDKDHIISGDVYSIIAHAFTDVREVLTETANWCDISLLHLNVKACTYHAQDDNRIITFYSGRKFYQPPEDAYVLAYRFQVIENQPTYLKICLTADAGPMDTADYRIQLEAMPDQEDKTFLRFSYSYRYGLVALTATEGYFATLGRSKLGFTVVDHDKNSNPVYIEGIRGAIERNAVRYYFAIRAYMDSLAFPEETRFEHRIALWYALTDQFKTQLFELTREEYINGKKQEYQNQRKLQAETAKKTE